MNLHHAQTKKFFCCLPRRESSRSEITATESAPASITDATFARVTPPMATSGFLVAQRGRRTIFPTRQRDRGSTLFRGCGKDRPVGDVVHRTDVQLASTAQDYASRNPDRSCRHQPPPRALGRQIVLPNVHSVEACGKAQVGAIVHDQLNFASQGAPQLTGAWLSMVRMSPSLLRYWMSSTPPAANSRANSTTPDVLCED